MNKFNLLRTCWRQGLLLLLATVFVGSAAHAEKSSYILNVFQKGAEQVADFKLSNGANVTFNETQLVITMNDGNAITYELADMWKFTYDVDPGSGLNSLNADAVSMRVLDDAIVFNAPQGGCDIKVIATNGAQVLSKTVGAAGEYVLSLSTLSKGVYLVNVNGITYKIVKK